MPLRLEFCHDSLDREITVDGMTFSRYDSTAPDGRWIIYCDRCGGSGKGGYSHYEYDKAEDGRRLGTGHPVYKDCSECEGLGLTLQEPIAPIKPCTMADHEWRIAYSGMEGLEIECLDGHSNLVKRAMAEYRDGLYRASCDPFDTEEMTWAFTAKLAVRTCSSPGGWHGMERCDCGWIIDIDEIVNLEKSSV